MKKLFIALVMISSFSAFSQDTLFTRNGEVILGKVHEITQTEIKYRKPSNPDGPLYTISKNDIAVIEYKNGSKDVFATQQQSSTTDNSGSNASVASPQVNNNYYGNPNQRPNVNVVLGVPGFGIPYYAWGGFGCARPYYYRPYYGGWGGCRHGHYHHRR